MKLTCSQCNEKVLDAEELRHHIIRELLQTHGAKIDDPNDIMKLDWVKVRWRITGTISDRTCMKHRKPWQRKHVFEVTEEDGSIWWHSWRDQGPCSKCISESIDNFGELCGRLERILAPKSR